MKNCSIQHTTQVDVPFTDWPYSTFHRYLRQGVYINDWAGVNNGQNDDFGEPRD